MAVLGASLHRDIEAQRYPLLMYALVPLVALVLQAWLPRLLRGHVWFDLPLLVTIYFALGRRSPIQGMMTGAVLGLFEDALGHHAIGINGITKTVAGFLAASLRIYIEVDNLPIRVILSFLLSLLTSVMFIFINRVLLGFDLEWNLLSEFLKAVGNTAIAFMLFPLLDRARVRD
jgi:rod shape-determining protein MreD